MARKSKGRHVPFPGTADVVTLFHRLLSWSFRRPLRPSAASRSLPQFRQTQTYISSAERASSSYWFLGLRSVETPGFLREARSVGGHNIQKVRWANRRKRQDQTTQARAEERIMRQKHWAKLIGIGFAAACLIWQGLVPQAFSATAPGVTDDTILIGITAPMTGAGATSAASSPGRGSGQQASGESAGPSMSRM